MTAKVLRAGPQASVQDRGRVKYRALGVGTSGALDPFAARVANLLVGNEEGAAVIEIALGNFRPRFADERLVAWCGGDFDVEVVERKIPPGHAFLVRAGEEIAIKNAKVGCRAWLAVSGGIGVPRVLDSRSTDLRAGFGGFDGRAMRDGDELPLGELPAASCKWISSLREPRLSSWSAPRAWVDISIRHPVLRFIRGTDWNYFSRPTYDALTAERFTVTQEADRMGARLDGPELKRNDTSDLLSEAVVPGTVQVPPNGKPILLLGDCQTIGGYPKIAHVITVDMPIAAQLRPGDKIQFHETSINEAHSLLLQRERDLACFRIGLDLKTA